MTMANDPDLRFCGFSLWIDRRQFLDASIIGTAIG
jgi:hypothetical protein